MKRRSRCRCSTRKCRRKPRVLQPRCRSNRKCKKRKPSRRRIGAAAEEYGEDYIDNDDEDYDDDEDEDDHDHEEDDDDERLNHFHYSQFQRSNRG